MGRASKYASAPVRRQRGAAAIFAAASIVLGLVCLGLAVDLGRFYLAQRDLQRLANMAALDAARVAGGCVGSIPDVQAAAEQEVLDSVLRNGGVAEWIGDGVRIGRLAGRESVRYFEPVADDKNRAVDVQLTRDAPGRLIPLFDSGDGPATLSASSAAYSAPSATVQMGTKVLTVNTSGQAQLNRLFTALLGSPVNLSVLTYQALLDAEVPLAGLLERLDVGTPDELLDTISQQQLLDALVDELNSLGETTAAAGAETLRNLASVSDQLLPGSVLGINDPVTPVVLSAADIAMAISQAGAAGELLNLPVGLPAPLNGTLDLLLVQPSLPTFLVPGGIDLFPENFASNTQLLARTSAPVNLALNLGIVNVNVSSNLKLFVQAGKGTAEVDHLSCARRGQSEDLAYVRAQTGVLNVGIGEFTDITAPNPVPQKTKVVDTTVSVNLGLFTVPIRIVASAYAYVPLASSNSILPQPFEAGETRHLGTPRVTQIAGNINASNVAVTIDTLQVIGSFPLIAGLVNTVLGLLGPALQLALQNQVVSLLTSLADQSVLPLLDYAGVTAGGADVTVTAIDAAQPYLFTH